MNTVFLISKEAKETILFTAQSSKSQEAIQRFKERCENMPLDYLETFSVLWGIDYE